jgi:hypothetical protein
VAPASSSPASSAPAPTANPSPSPPATSTDAPGRSLPFTGLDLWPAVAVGFGLIGSGLVLRRLARR